MKGLSVLLMAALLAACAAPDETTGENTEQAVRDFIAARQLDELDKIRTRSNDHFQEIDAHFLIYKTRNDAYLFEFDRACYELTQDIIVADERWEGNTIRSRFDTLRGCRIGHIYALTEAEVAELENLGESVGSRN